jgi:hypothetical protein
LLIYLFLCQLSAPVFSHIKDSKLRLKIQEVFWFYTQYFKAINEVFS